MTDSHISNNWDSGNLDNLSEEDLQKEFEKTDNLSAKEIQKQFENRL